MQVNVVTCGDLTEKHALQGVQMQTITHAGVAQQQKCLLGELGP